jgi:hypothetical protein
MLIVDLVRRQAGALQAPPGMVETYHQLPDLINDEF